MDCKMRCRDRVCLGVFERERMDPVLSWRQMASCACSHVKSS